MTSSSFEVVCDTSDHSSWLEARLTGIGASEMPILLGASDWGSNVELYYRKRGELEESISEDNELMLWGRLLEPAIRDELARRASVTLSPAPSKLLRSALYPWALATADSLTADNEPVEVKNLNWGFDEEEWSEGIPLKYFIQCQQQLLVTGASRCLFGSLIRGSQLIWEWVPRDELRIRRIIKAGSEFWAHVEAGECPPSDGHPNARKVLAQQATNDEAIELFESDIGPLLERYERAKKANEDATKVAKKTKRQLDAEKDELAKALGEHREGVTSSGWTFRWKTTSRRGHTVAPSTFKTFEIKEPKNI